MGFNSATSEGTHRHPGLRAVAWLCTALFAVASLPVARASFIGYYAPSNFILTNVPLESANGFPDFSDSTLVLTGSNDGSGIEGTTDLTILSGGAGVFQFDWTFEDQVDPDGYLVFPYGGYLVGERFIPLSNAFGGSGSITVPVQAGELIGFRVGGDNQGGPGVLTITGFAAPVPEPGTLLCVAAALAVISCRRRMRRRATPPGDCFWP
jgi:hypothetical protein